jgi:hypothetical protein
VLFATYLGGSGDEYVPTSQAVDPKGNLYIAGYTSLADFPVTAGAFQTDPGPNLNGPGASFVSKFDPTGKLVYSTYFHGGNQTGTNVTSIAADATGNAYMTGTHGGGSLPTTPGAFQTSASGQWAASSVPLPVEPWSSHSGSEWGFCSEFSVPSSLIMSACPAAPS